MWNDIFGTMWGWIGTAGVVCVAALVVGYIFPQTRVIALAVIGVVVSAATIYSKGSRDRAASGKAATDKAVKQVQTKYDKIDARPDSNESVAERLRDHSF